MLTRDDIKLVQQQLKSAGLYFYDVDGLHGKFSQQGLMQYQKIHGLTVDGLIGPEVMEHMFPDNIEERMVPKQPPPPVLRTLGQAWPTQAGVPAFFGNVGVNQKTLVFPYPMYYGDQQVTRTSVHAKVHDSAMRVLTRVKGHYSPENIHAAGLNRFGGCLNVRKMRGGTAWSMHSWGIAFDFDPARNQLKWGRDRARLARPDCEPFWRFWEEEGWVSLGRVRNFDWMHVQAARL